MKYKQNYQSPLGQMTILTDEKSLLGLWFEDQKYFGAGYDLKIAKNEENKVIWTVKNWLDAYFKGENPSLESLPLAPEVTDFRQKVLVVMEAIPYGQTVSYQELLHSLRERYGKIGSARAVGGAVGHNPISIIIPCHRVLGSDGSLTGYAGGIERKIALLKLEGVLE